MTRVTYGIIGCGGAALPVSEALAASAVAQLGKVHDLNLALARDLGEKYHVPHAAHLDEILADPALDIVYIAAPHDQLFPLAKAALTAGKHALVEKPMALTLHNADELIALAENLGLKLGVFYELRHTGPCLQAHELIQAGILGKIVGVRVQTLIDKPLSYWKVGYSGRSHNPWRGQKARAGGGIVLMNSSHQIDLIRYLTGLEIQCVSAQIGTLIAPVEVEDAASAVLVFDNGAIGSLFAMAHTPGAEAGYDEHFDIIGTKGQMKIPDPYGNGPLRVFLREQWGDISPGEWHTLSAQPSDAYRGAIDAFSQVVQADKPVPTSGHDGRQALSVVLSIYQAAAEGRLIACS